MHYLYLVKSKKTGEYYLGCTSDLRKRILEHNTNKSFHTKNKGPWEVRYYEAYYSKADAFQREKQLKKNKSGYRELRKRLLESLK
jgi:putative endonuclease